MKKIFLLILTLVLVCFSFTACSSDTVMTINNEKVSRGEAGYFLIETVKSFEQTGGEDIWETSFDGVSAAEVAKEGVLDTLKTVVIAAQKAESLGISLTDDEKTNVKSNAAYAFTNLEQEGKDTYGTTQEDIEKMLLRAAIYSKIIDKMTEDLEIDDEKYSEYFSLYAETYRDNNTKVSMQNLLVADEETALIAKEKAENGEDFTELINEYEIDESLKGTDGTATLYKSTLENIFGTSLDISEGEVTVIPSSDGYYVIKINEITSPTDSELDEIVLDTYKDETAAELFNTECEGWLEDADVSVNEDIWNEMELLID